MSKLYNEYIRLDVIEVLFQGDKYTINHIKQIWNKGEKERIKEKTRSVMFLAVMLLGNM